MTPKRAGDWLWLPLDLLKTLAVIVWSVFWIFIALCLRLVTGKVEIPLAMARRPWAVGVLFLTGFRVEIEAQDLVDWDRPYFVAANHQSFLDIPVLFWAVPVGLHFVVKKELSRVPVLAWYVAAMGMIFVDRSRPEKARESIHKTAEAATSGKTILLFPEGTRSRSGEIGPLKSGMLSAAALSEVPVLPVAIGGTGAGMAPGWIPRYRPRVIKVRFGNPLPTEQYGVKGRRQLADEVHGRLVRLYGQVASRSAGPEYSGEAEMSGQGWTSEN